jgi:hypothetical protein
MQENFLIAPILAPFSLAPMSFDTTLIIFALHHESNGFFPFFLKDYELYQDLSFHLIFSSYHSNTCRIYLQMALYGMVFEHLRNCFHLEPRYIRRTLPQRKKEKKQAKTFEWM